MEEDLQTNGKQMEDEPINLISCDTIVNSPSFLSLFIATTQPTTQNNLKQLLLGWLYYR
jgi:hypothetical protein